MNDYETVAQIGRCRCTCKLINHGMNSPRPMCPMCPMCPPHNTLVLLLYVQGPCYIHLMWCSFNKTSQDRLRQHGWELDPHMLIWQCADDGAVQILTVWGFTCTFPHQRKKNLYICSQPAFDFICLSCVVPFLSIKAYQLTLDRLCASEQFNKVMDLWWFTNRGGRGSSRLVGGYWVGRC